MSFCEIFCEICQKKINSDSQYINGNWYHNNCIENLQKENKHLKSELECYENGLYFSSEVDKLQEKINKAIEYIEERKTLNWYADGVFVYELLNILQEVK